MTMAHTRTYEHSLTGAAAGPRLGFLANALKAFGTWRTRRAAIAQLHALEDRDLRDIGVSRSEIESVVYFGGRDPTRLRRG
jgi:uncharacterized protein YjiS (DUF1127 family)